MRIHLVPPSLTVLGRIITKRIPLTEHFASLADWMQSSWTLDNCTEQGFPRLKLHARGIGQGLAVAWTEDDAGILLWVGEVACHPLCIVTDERKCTHLLPFSERMKMAAKRHAEYLQILPTYGNITSRGNFAAQKGTS